MLRLAHVINSCSPLPLQCPLRDFHTLHERAENLDLHFRPDFGQVISHEHGCVRAGAFDRKNDAGERLAGLEGRVEDVANFGAFFVGLVEEACSCPCRIEDG